MPQDNLLTQALDALERLMRMFAIERILYLICAIVSFVLLIVCLAIMFKNQIVTYPQLAMVFGASGLIAASAARVSFFLNKSFKLIERIMERLAQMERSHGD